MYQCSKKLKNTVVLTILTFQLIQCLHLMYAEVAWVLVSSGTQVQPQMILDPDYFQGYLSVFHDCDGIYCVPNTLTLNINITLATSPVNVSLTNIWHNLQKFPHNRTYLFIRDGCICTAAFRSARNGYVKLISPFSSVLTEPLKLCTS